MTVNKYYHKFKKEGRVILTGTVVEIKRSYVWVEIDDKIIGMNSSRVLVHHNAIKKLRGGK